MKWAYDRAEVIADGLVHALGLALGLAGVLSLLVQVSAQAPAQSTAALIYGAGLLTVLGLSATYNLWPISPTKWVLRRFDHAAIYFLIASTYTPFLTHIAAPAASRLLIGVWLVACAGMILKLTYPARFERLSILLYLGLGWSGVLVYEQVITGLPLATVWLLVVGACCIPQGCSSTSGRGCASTT